MTRPAPRQAHIAASCHVCMDARVIVGSLPCLPVTAPLRRLPCPRCRRAQYRQQVAA